MFLLLDSLGNRAVEYGIDGGVSGEVYQILNNQGGIIAGAAIAHLPVEVDILVIIAIDDRIDRSGPGLVHDGLQDQATVVA